jgi:hypothetical protein
MEHNERKRKEQEMLADYDYHTWTKENLRNDGRYTISDIDSVIRDRTDDGTNRIMILEKKCFNAEVKECQAVTYRLIDALIRKGLEACNGEIEIKICGKNQKTKVEYFGTHLLQLSDATFEQSDFKFDRKDVNLSQLIDTLNFTNQSTT